MERVRLHQDIKDKTEDRSAPRPIVHSFNAHLTRRENKQDPALGGSCFKSYIYEIGDVEIAHVHVYAKGGHPAGQYVFGKRPQTGNGSKGFETEKDLHKHLWDQLNK